MKYLFTICYLMFFFTTVFSQNQKLLPRNEYSKDTTLNSYVVQLKNAIKNKNMDFILNSLDKDIKNNFGGDDGIEGFKTMWNISSPKTELWTILEKVISLGGVFIGGKDSRFQFVFPYVFDLKLENSDDYYSVMVVTTNKLAVKENPNKNSKTKAELSYDVVWIENWNSFKTECQADGWTFIRTLDKQISGFVENKYLYSPIGYRLFLSKKEGNWKITGLIAGD